MNCNKLELRLHGFAYCLAIESLTVIITGICDLSGPWVTFPNNSGCVSADTKIQAKSGTKSRYGVQCLGQTKSQVSCKNDK